MVITVSWYHCYRKRLRIQVILVKKIALFRKIKSIKERRTSAALIIHSKSLYYISAILSRAELNFKKNKRKQIQHGVLSIHLSL